jgi:hypothetical protein
MVKARRKEKEKENSIRKYSNKKGWSGEKERQRS